MTTRLPKSFYVRAEAAGDPPFTPPYVSGGISVHIVSAYVPTLTNKIPGYGIRANGSALTIVLSNKAPKELLELLEEELVSVLLHHVPTSMQAFIQYADRLTNDFLRAHVICGNLRFDRVKEGWRWVGEPSR